MVLIAFVGLGVGYGIVSILREKTFITEEEITKRINQDLPKSSSLATVVTFINSFGSQFQLSIFDYTEGIPLPTDFDAPNNPLPEAKGYVGAWVDRTGVTPMSFITWNTKMLFYLDKDKRLVGYKIRTIGDGL